MRLVPRGYSLYAAAHIARLHVDYLTCCGVASPVGRGRMVHQCEKILCSNRPLVKAAAVREQEAYPPTHQQLAMVKGRLGFTMNSLELAPGYSPRENGMVVRRPCGISKAATEHQLWHKLVEMSSQRLGFR